MKDKYTKVAEWAPDGDLPHTREQALAVLKHYADTGSGVWLEKSGIARLLECLTVEKPRPLKAQFMSGRYDNRITEPSWFFRVEEGRFGYYNTAVEAEQAALEYMLDKAAQR